MAKLLLVIIEGQLYLVAILAIFVAEFAVLAWGLWSRRPIISLIARPTTATAATRPTQPT